MIKDVLNLLLEAKPLCDVEIKETFDEIIKGVADEINAGSLVSLFNIKKFDDVLISSAIESIRDGISRINTDKSFENIIEVSTFKYDDRFSYLYIAMDTILASVGLFVSRNFFEEDKQMSLFKVYSSLNNEDIFNNLDFFEKSGIYLNIYKTTDNYLKYCSSIKKTLNFDNILNLADLFLNPLNAKNLFLGINSSLDLETMAKIALNLKYSNTIIVSNENCAFVSPIGETKVLEAWKNKIFSYLITPDLFEIKECDIEKLICNDFKDALYILSDVFKNKVKTPFYNFIVLNSAFALYISKKAPSLFDAYNLANSIIQDGIAFEKFKLLSNYTNL